MLTDSIEAKSANNKVEFISDNAAKFKSIALTRPNYTSTQTNNIITR